MATKNKILVSILIIIVVVAILLLTVFAKKEEIIMPSDSPLSSESYYSAPKETESQTWIQQTNHPSYYASFENIVEDSTCVIIGKYIGSEAKDENILSLTFEVIEELHGETGDSTIEYPLSIELETIIMDDYTYKYTPINKFELDEEYILILNRWRMIYYDYEWYTHIGNLYIPTNPDKFHEATIYGMSLDVEGVTNVESLIDYIAAIFPENQPLFYGSDYTDSSDWQEIVNASNFIAEVEIVKFSHEGVHNGNSYEAGVVELYKGEVKTAGSKDCISIVILKSIDIEVGQKYLVLMNIQDNSVVYSMSSYNSVIPIEDTETVNEILDLVK